MRSTLRRLSVLVGGLVAAGVSYSAEDRPAAGPKTYPKQVLIIRHAEKPTDDAESPELTAAGKDRAAALFKLFERSAARSGPFPTPDFIFAGKDSKKSRRPVLTVLPLSKKLGLPVDSGYGSDDVDGLAGELFGNPKYAGKTVLISWRHGKIPALAAGLGAATAPDHWKDEVFDRVWLITYGKDGKAAFADRPQQLMPKDSAE